jgi:DUF971 family protein
VTTDPRNTPLEIGPDEEGTRLRIRWKDGFESTHLPRDLRLACPCAGCVDEMTGKRTLAPASVPPDIHPLAIHYVGRYALQFVWSDGHQTGIYPFDYLRRLAESDPERG